MTADHALIIFWAFAAALGVIAFLYIRRKTRASPRSTGEVYHPKDESDVPGWER